MSDAVFEVSIGNHNAVVVELSGNAANVLLMDRSNFYRYGRGDSFRHAGGFFRESPAIFRPGAGDWVVVVNVPGGGRTRAEVSVH